jgi:DNA-binding NarL/FixJ family response regulator
LIQTVFNDSDKIFQAMCAGASGYILKNDPPNKYLEAISEVYNGGAPMSMAVAKKVLGFFSNKNIILVSPSNENFQLTTREKELLSLMIEGHHYKAIAEKTFISYDTVRTHVKHIYQKLHVASRNEAIMKAIQQGLV